MLIKIKNGQRRNKKVLRCYLGTPRGSGVCGSCPILFMCRKFDRAFNGRYKKR